MLKSNLEVCIRNSLNVRVHELFNASNTFHKAIIVDKECQQLNNDQARNLKHFISMFERLLSREKIVIVRKNASFTLQILERFQSNCVTCLFIHFYFLLNLPEDNR